MASGLVAHADRVLTGEECERLMAMVESEVDGDEYGEWTALIGDAEGLEAALQRLEPPPAETHRQILEDAWLMAVVDGERACEEITALEHIAERLGVQMLQLEFWREAWTQAQHAYAETATAALAWVLGGGEAVGEAAAETIKEFVGTLPTTHEHREQLEGAAREAEELGVVEGRMRGLSPALRRDGIRRLLVAARDVGDGEAAVGRWRELAVAVRLSEEEIERISRE